METSYSSEVSDEQEPKVKGSSFWRELPVLLGVAILVAIVVRAFVMQTFYIPSPSMQHTLNINDRVLVNKLVYDFRDPERGEIVVFKAPPEWRSDPGEVDFIKRVIGVGGDHVVCCDAQGRMSVNGKALDETSYLYKDPGQPQDKPSTYAFDIHVPAGRLWVMGDHRSESGDSRENYENSGRDIMRATISVDDVVGKAFVLFWPFSRADWLTIPPDFNGIPDATEK
jgi:signal peptidase I